MNFKNVVVKFTFNFLIFTGFIVFAYFWLFSNKIAVQERDLLTIKNLMTSETANRMLSSNGVSFKIPSAEFNGKYDVRVLMRLKNADAEKLPKNFILPVNASLKTEHISAETNLVFYKLTIQKIQKVRQVEVERGIESGYDTYYEDGEYETEYWEEVAEAETNLKGIVQETNVEVVSSYSASLSFTTSPAPAFLTLRLPKKTGKMIDRFVKEGVKFEVQAKTTLIWRRDKTFAFFGTMVSLILIFMRRRILYGRKIKPLIEELPVVKKHPNYQVIVNIDDKFEEIAKRIGLDDLLLKTGTVKAWFRNTEKDEVEALVEIQTNSGTEEITVGKYIEDDEGTKVPVCYTAVEVNLPSEILEKFPDNPPSEIPFEGKTFSLSFNVFDGKKYATSPSQVFYEDPDFADAVEEIVEKVWEYEWEGNPDERTGIYLQVIEDENTGEKYAQIVQEVYTTYEVIAFRTHKKGESAVPMTVSLSYIVGCALIVFGGINPAVPVPSYGKTDFVSAYGTYDDFKRKTDEIFETQKIAQIERIPPSQPPRSAHFYPNFETFHSTPIAYDRTYVVFVPTPRTRVVSVRDYSIDEFEERYSRGLRRGK